MAIFEEVTENECVMHRRSHTNITYLLFSNSTSSDKIFVKFRFVGHKFILYFVVHAGCRKKVNVRCLISCMFMC